MIARPKNVTFFNHPAKMVSQLANWLQLNNVDQYCFLCDTNTLNHCFPFIEQYWPQAGNTFDIIEIPAGDDSKSIAHVSHIWEYLNEQNFTRNSALICIGGGMITDLGGFAASTFKRGLKLIYIPTTYLAMVDAAYGGKTALNFKGNKNIIGNYYTPNNIFILPEFLSTLPQKTTHWGYSETIKHALIYDKNFWENLVSKNIAINSLKAIKYSLAIKASVVKIDPLESHFRKILNFGHTIGHAIEAYSLTKKGAKMPHGEAVTHGMLTELIIAKNLKLLAQQDFMEAYNGVLQLLKPKPKKFTLPQLLPFLLVDKKNHNQQINMALINQIGSAIPKVTVLPSEIEKALAQLW